MLRMKIASFCLLAVVAVSANAKTPAVVLTCASAAGVATVAEMDVKPVAGSVYTLNVTFIGKRPPNAEIDRVLRDCLAAAVKRDGTKDIMAAAWRRKGTMDNPYDDELTSPYGDASKNLIYRAKAGAIKLETLMNLTLQ